MSTSISSNVYFWDHHNFPFKISEDEEEGYRHISFLVGSISQQILDEQNNIYPGQSYSAFNNSHRSMRLRGSYAVSACVVDSSIQYRLTNYIL